MELVNASASGLLFIDVDAKPLLPIIKEERESSPDEALSKVKKVKDKKFQCTECTTFSSYSAERLTRHIRRAHRGQKPFQCSLCEYTTSNSVMFEEHVNIHKGVKPYQCKHCPYRSVSKKYLKFHEAKHSVCDKCGHLAQNSRALKKHRRVNGCKADRNTEIFECVPCNHKFDTEKSLKVHKKGHVQCSQCTESFCRSALAVHMVEVHGVEKPKVSTSKKKFECAQCEWTSNCRQKILLHIIHHPKQVFDGRIDVTPLVEAGILEKYVNIATYT